MILKGIIDEDFINYKEPAMVLEFPLCSFKCDKECGLQVCQNSKLASAPNIEIDIYDIILRYRRNPITTAIVMQGLEPLDSWKDVKNFIEVFRQETDDDIVIYTGYKENEITSILKELHNYYNIIIKFGRFIPGQQPHYDDILGVNLASDNQYSCKIN